MSVQVSKLSNGVTVVTDHMPHLESAALGIWVKSGARDEREDQHGIAHLLEHMAFKGTNSRSARDIAEQIESVGGEVNAATSVETTCFYARVMKDDVPLAIDILSDILLNSTFEEDELRREQHVILQEIGAALDSPEDVVFDQFQTAAFGDQAIGRTILGTPETVAGFTPDDIRDYLNTHYHGANMVLSAAGAVDHDAIVKAAEARLSQFAPEPAEPPVEGHYVGGETLTSRDLKETQIVLGFEGRAYHVRDFYASQVLAVLLGGGMSSRLFQEIREKRGLCYSVYAFHWGFSDTGVFGVHAATGEEDVPELMPVLLQELASISDNIEQKEVERARAQIRSSLMMSMESPASRAGQIARQILLYGRPVPNEELLERLGAISRERLMDLSGRLFHESGPTVSAIGPVDTVMRSQDIADHLSAGARVAAQ
ncbi:MAG: pitrilysin family protein [Pseudomonadota bacterium]